LSLAANALEQPPLWDKLRVLAKLRRMSLYRAEKLIDLACSTTHAEEARTAALAACKLIRKHGLRLTADEPLRTTVRQPQPQPTPARASRPEPVREKPPNGGYWTEATRSARCESCGGGIDAGDEVYSVGGVIWCSRH
jgi:hypothetical protein